MAVPVWHSGLTRQQSKDIERVQKIAFRIILGEQYKTYQLACSQLSAQTLESRRLKLSVKFAKTNFKSDNCMFSKIESNVNTRQTKRNLVTEYKCNTRRYQRSSLPFLAQLLNSDNRK